MGKRAREDSPKEPINHHQRRPTWLLTGWTSLVSRSPKRVFSVILLVTSVVLLTVSTFSGDETHGGDGHGGGMGGMKLKSQQPHVRQYVAGQEPKLLIPHLLYGPNNQLHGFKEAMLLARVLNRTLVTPRILKHYTQFAKRTPKYYEFEDVVDVALLSHYGPVMGLEKARGLCRPKDITVWRLRVQQVYLEFEKRFEVVQEIPLGPQSNRLHLGTVHKTTNSGDVFFSSVEDLVDTLLFLNTEAPCIVVSCLYGSLFDFSGDFSKNLMLGELLDASLFLRYKESLHREVLGLNLLNSSYLALHIRTDEREEQCLKDAHDRNAICVGLGRPYYHTNLACLVKFVEDKVRSFHLSGVYLATSPRSDGLIEAFRGANFKLVMFEDLKAQGLVADMEPFFESEFEQIIATQATYFVGTRQSTWTQFVVTSRLAMHAAIERNAFVDDLSCTNFYSLAPKKKSVALKGLPVADASLAL